MREIKFRGRVDERRPSMEGQWVYGSIVTQDQYAPYIRTITLEYIGVDEKTVGQFTGLKDLMGKEIYEGDIVEISPQFSAKQGLKRKFHLPAVVRWDERWARFVVISKEILDSIPDSETVSVIGNVHDNPELLEVEA